MAHDGHCQPKVGISPTFKKVQEGSSPMGVEATWWQSGMSQDAEVKWPREPSPSNLVCLSVEVDGHKPSGQKPGMSLEVDVDGQGSHAVHCRWWMVELDGHVGHLVEIWVILILQLWVFLLLVQLHTREETASYYILGRDIAPPPTPIHNVISSPTPHLPCHTLHVQRHTCPPPSPTTPPCHTLYMYRGMPSPSMSHTLHVQRHALPLHVTHSTCTEACPPPPCHTLYMYRGMPSPSMSHTLHVQRHVPPPPHTHTVHVQRHVSPPTHTLCMYRGMSPPPPPHTHTACTEACPPPLHVTHSACTLACRPLTHLPCHTLKMYRAPPPFPPLYKVSFPRSNSVKFTHQKRLW